MAHALLSHEGHTLVNGLFRPCNDDVSFHDVPHGRCGRHFTLENNIPRIVPFGDNANELVAFHHYQRPNVHFSHFRDGIEDRSIRVDRPSVPALLIKQLSHRSHLDPPSGTSPGKILDNNPSNFHRRNFVMNSDCNASASACAHTMETAYSVRQLLAKALGLAISPQFLARELLRASRRN